MSQPPFVMSKYMSTEELYKDKANYYEKRCKELEELLEKTQPPVPEKLTLGMRAKFKPGGRWEEYGEREVLLIETSPAADFGVMILGQQELKKEDSKTVYGEVWWVKEDELVFINADFATNMPFIDWYRSNEDGFCYDCGAWHPDQDGIKDNCPNKDCPGHGC